MEKSRLNIIHRVPGTVGSVFKRFNEDLFKRLTPAFPPAKLLRYDGNSPGDLVVIRLGIWPLYQRWVSEITEHVEGVDASYFIDVGRKLPFPLTSWRHKHIIRKGGGGEVEIVEDIQFAAKTAFMTRIMRPIIRAQFEARGPKYLAFFTDAT